MQRGSTLLWIQRDFRIKDNVALHRACSIGQPILPVFIFSREEDHPWERGSASCSWLHHSLIRFEKELKGIELSLWIQEGKTVPILEKLISQTQATHLFWNRCYDPSALKREKKILKIAQKQGCIAEGFPGALLFEPTTILTQQGKPYTLFTPFYKNCLKEGVPNQPKLKLKHCKQLSFSRKGLKVEDLDLLPDIPWDKGFYPFWEPGEKGAWKRLEQFKKAKITRYGKRRDFPFEDPTSRLSAHLHFGEITPARIWSVLQHQQEAKSYLRQLIWREFAHHLLYFFPTTPLQSFRKEFQDFPWKKNARLLHLWQRGKTGIPIVDAGMRQLWLKGWMHNRVRMIVASFLIKDLMIPWQEGAKWFWDTLVDADLANNTLGWQWCAGCGADAAPYFRIFNPLIQSEKFDPKGDYIRTFVPELKKLPASWIHRPHEAPEEILKKAGIILGKTYPYPLVDHAVARKAALELYFGYGR